jgi:hypothetical protein
MIAFTVVSVGAGIIIYLVSQSARHGKTEEQLVDQVAVEVGADVATVEATHPHPAD